MSELTDERHLEVAELVPQILSGVESDESGDEQSDPFDTAQKRRVGVSDLVRRDMAVKLADLATQPMEMPVSVSQIHQSSSNGLRVLTHQ